MQLWELHTKSLIQLIPTSNLGNLSKMLKTQIYAYLGHFSQF